MIIDNNERNYGKTIEKEDSHASIENPRRHFGELRSVDRVTQLNKKKETEKEQVKNFREKSMEWYRRKVRDGEK